MSYSILTSQELFYDQRKVQLGIIYMWALSDSTYLFSIFTVFVTSSLILYVTRNQSLAVG